MRFFVITFVFCLFGCGFTKVKNLTYYQSNAEFDLPIRTDGYYSPSLTSGVRPLFLYVDGTAGQFHPLEFDNEDQLEQYINNQQYQFGFGLWWGAFKVLHDSINIQIITKVDRSYGPPNFYDAVEYKGTIVNDTSFRIVKEIYPRILNSKKKKMRLVNRLFVFHRFESKPDSTSNWIKESIKIHD